MNGATVAVEFIGGHLDGGRLEVPADRDGVPVEQIVVTGLPPAPVGWTPDDVIRSVGPAVTRYWRMRRTVGGMLHGWVMVADGHRSTAGDGKAGRPTGG